MSSFVHTPEVIVYITNAIADICPDVFQETHYKANGTLDYEKLARDIMQMNVEAVNNRYRENEAVPYIFFSRKCVNKFQGLKYLESLIYQICDCYDMTLPFALQIQEARSIMAMSIISKMPEYEMCKWS